MRYRFSASLGRARRGRPSGGMGFDRRGSFDSGNGGFQEREFSLADFNIQGLVGEGEFGKVRSPAAHAKKPAPKLGA